MCYVHMPSYVATAGAWICHRHAQAPFFVWTKYLVLLMSLENSQTTDRGIHSQLSSSALSDLLYLLSTL